MVLEKQYWNKSINNNLNFVYDLDTRKPYTGIEVIPIDLNGKIDPDENFYGTLDDIMKATTMENTLLTTLTPP